MIRCSATNVVLAAAWLLAGCGPGGTASTTVRPDAPPAAGDAIEFYRPGDPLSVQVTGEDFRWRVRYAGADGELGTDDDVEREGGLRLPSGAPVRLVLKSRDYVYSFALPEVGLDQIAVPDMTFTLDFTPEAPGPLELRGGQFCGYRHPALSGTILVQPPEEFARWLAAAGP